MNLFSKPPAKVENRRFGVELDFAYTDIDSISYMIPEGYTPEAVFKDEVIESDFGTYSVSMNIEKDLLKYVREVEMNNGNWPAERYNDFREFYNKIWKADQANVVFIKK